MEFENAAASFVELLLELGSTSPDTLERQRRVRLAAAGAALAVNAGVVLLGQRASVGWWLMGIATLVALWVLAFSGCDQGVGLTTWMSIAAALLALATIAAAATFVF
jgi:hypothetical protein